MGVVITVRVGVRVIDTGTVNLSLSPIIDCDDTSEIVVDPSVKPGATMPL